MHRSDVNPWEWSKAFGYSQAVDVTSPERVLFCAGQTASYRGSARAKSFEGLPFASIV